MRAIRITTPTVRRCCAACRYGSDEMVDRWMHWVTDDWDSLQPGNYEEHAAAAAAPDSNSSNGSRSSSQQQVAVGSARE